MVRAGSNYPTFLTTAGSGTETLTLKYSVLTVEPSNAGGRKRCRDWPGGDIQSRSVRREYHTPDLWDFDCLMFNVQQIDDKEILYLVVLLFKCLIS